MTDMSICKTRDEARQIFRQFAWNIAGTLAKAGKSGAPARTTRIRRVTRKRVSGK